MTSRLLLLTLVLAGLASCNKPSASSDAQRAADEKRLTELRDLEERAAQREAEAKATQLDAERQQLAADQAALEQEKQQLAAEREAARNDPQKQEQYLQSERRLAQRESAHQAEQARAEEAERAADKAREAHEAKRAAAARKIDFFYDALDPVGDWIEVQPYGYVFQPHTAQSPGYRPYTDGTWVYTDYGWTWKGNEPSGWATDHYGRWTRLKGKGWVWVPGSEWAPAWVSWRKSPQYVGWAPLPPEAHSSNGFNGAADSYYDIGPTTYNFVPARSLGEPTYRGLIVDPERNYTIIEGTSNATRMHYATYGREPVYYNEGPDYDEINGYSARPIARYRLERESSRERSSGGGGLAVAGNILRLLAPFIAPAPRASATPSRVSTRLGTVASDHGWGTGSSDSIQGFRNRTRQEATQAEQQAQTQTAATPVRIGHTFGTGGGGTPRPFGGTTGTVASPRPIGGGFGTGPTPRGAGGTFGASATPGSFGGATGAGPTPRTGFGTGPTPRGLGVVTPKPAIPAGGTPRIGTAFTPRPSTPFGVPSTPTIPPIQKVIRESATPAATPRIVDNPVVNPTGSTPAPAPKPSTPKGTPTKGRAPLSGTPKAPTPGRPPGLEGAATPRPANLDNNPGEALATPRPLPPTVPRTTPVPHVTPPPSLPNPKPRTATGGGGVPVIPATNPRRGPVADPDGPDPRKTLPPTSTPRHAPAVDPNGGPEPRKTLPPASTPRRAATADLNNGLDPRRTLPPATTPRRVPAADPNGGPDPRKIAPPVNKPGNATPSGVPGKKKPGASPDPNDPTRRL